MGFSCLKPKYTAYTVSVLKVELCFRQKLDFHSWQALCVLIRIAYWKAWDGGLHHALEIPFMEVLARTNWTQPYLYHFRYVWSLELISMHLINSATFFLSPSLSAKANLRVWRWEVNHVSLTAIPGHKALLMYVIVARCFYDPHVWCLVINPGKGHQIQPVFRMLIGSLFYVYRTMRDWPPANRVAMLMIWGSVCWEAQRCADFLKMVMSGKKRVMTKRL